MGNSFFKTIAGLVTTFSKLEYMLGIPTVAARKYGCRIALSKGVKAESLLRDLRYTKDVHEFPFNSQLSRVIENLSPSSKAKWEKHVSELLLGFHKIILQNYIKYVDYLQPYTDKNKMYERSENDSELRELVLEVFGIIERIRRFEASLLSDPYFTKLFPSDYRKL